MASLSLAVALCHAQLSYGGGPYSQNFDTLASSGTANAWTQNVTLPGWFWLRAPSSTVGRQAGGWIDLATYSTTAGTTTTGAAYSLGTVGTGERALGAIGSGNAASGDYVYALVLQNMTGMTINSFTLNYAGEQWRNGGNTSLASQTVVFDYAVRSSFASTDLNGDATAGYTLDPALDFVSPQNGSTAAALDGNAAANRVGLSDSEAVTVLPGEFLLLRWFDDNHAGNDHALGIDDLELTTTVVPEPASMLALGVGALAVAFRRRRK